MGKEMGGVLGGVGGVALLSPVIRLRACGLLSRLDRQTQATTLVHQIFGGYLRSRGKWRRFLCLFLSRIRRLTGKR